MTPDLLLGFLFGWAACATLWAITLPRHRVWRPTMNQGWHKVPRATKGNG